MPTPTIMPKTLSPPLFVPCPLIVSQVTYCPSSKGRNRLYQNFSQISQHAKLFGALPPKSRLSRPTEGAHRELEGRDPLIRMSTSRVALSFQSSLAPKNVTPTIARI